MESQGRLEADSVALVPGVLTTGEGNMDDSMSQDFQGTRAAQRDVRKGGG